MSQKMKRYLMLLAVIGIVAVAAGGSGTFASFNAEVANNGNYLATGTLFLHATKSGGNICKSELDSTNSNITANGCDILFNVSQLGTNQTSTVNLQLDNAGSINAAALKFALGSACVDGTPTITNPTSPVSSGAQTTIAVSALPQALVKGTVIKISEGANNDDLTLATTAASGATSIDVTGSSTVNTYTTAAKITIKATFGSAALCSNLKVYIQEKTASWAADSKCVYPTGGGTTCGFGAATIGGIGTTLNDLTPDLWTGGTNGAAALNAGDTRWFTIAVQSPASFTNTQQNASAQFDLKWHIDQ